MTLSKFLYTHGIQCQKSTLVKEKVLLKCGLFLNGREVAFNFKYGIMIYTTIQWLDSEVKDIYETTFSYGRILTITPLSNYPPFKLISGDSFIKLYCFNY